MNLRKAYQRDHKISKRSSRTRKERVNLYKISKEKIEDQTIKELRQQKEEAWELNLEGDAD